MTDANADPTTTRIRDNFIPTFFPVPPMIEARRLHIDTQ
jgi:hypothetical protein